MTMNTVLVNLNAPAVASGLKGFTRVEVIRREDKNNHPAISLRGVNVKTENSYGLYPKGKTQSNASFVLPGSMATALGIRHGKRYTLTQSDRPSPGLEQGEASPFFDLEIHSDIPRPGEKGRKSRLPFPLLSVTERGQTEKEEYAAYKVAAANQRKKAAEKKAAEKKAAQKKAAQKKAAEKKAAQKKAARKKAKAAKPKVAASKTVKTETVQPAEPVEAVQPVEVKEAVQPAEVKETVQPAEPVEAVQPVPGRLPPATVPVVAKEENLPVTTDVKTSDDHLDPKTERQLVITLNAEASRQIRPYPRIHIWKRMSGQNRNTVVVRGVHADIESRTEKTFAWTLAKNRTTLQILVPEDYANRLGLEDGQRYELRKSTAFTDAGPCYNVRPISDSLKDTRGFPAITPVWRGRRGRPITQVEQSEIDHQGEEQLVTPPAKAEERVDEEARLLAERQEAEARLAEETRKVEQAAAEARLAEEQEQARLAEETRKAEQAAVEARLAEEQEQARLAEEQEQARLAEETRKAEQEAAAARLAEEQALKAEEAPVAAPAEVMEGQVRRKRGRPPKVPKVAVAPVEQSAGQPVAEPEAVPTEATAAEPEPLGEPVGEAALEAEADQLAADQPMVYQPEPEVTPVMADSAIDREEPEPAIPEPAAQPEIVHPEIAAAPEPVAQPRLPSSGLGDLVERLLLSLHEQTTAISQAMQASTIAVTRTMEGLQTSNNRLGKVIEQQGKQMIKLERIVDGLRGELAGKEEAKKPFRADPPPAAVANESVNH